MTRTPWTAFMYPHERAALAAFQRAHDRRQRDRINDWWRWDTWLP